MHTINITHHINAFKDRNHVTISKDGDKAFKFKHTFVIKTPEKNRDGRIIFQHNTAHIFDKVVAIMLCGGNFRVFLIKSEIRQGYPLLHPYL